ncbi:hypothetical protein LCGC14_2028480 [marine sediment metagenome]|uniref:Uncharacterized protein n=1 Tax=marine sediment metagenome TaxID=412755 RepID=A0A0F9FHX8_9ZZZZ
MSDRKIKQINLAIIETQRFLEKARLWEARLEIDPMASISGSREGGDCKRASMDLTRVLASLRKS